MPSYHARVALNSAIFPLYSQASGRTIIIPELDENWDRNNAANTSPDKGVPQVFYMHNVLPIAEGFQSIGYNATLAAYGAGTNTDFDQAYTIYSSEGYRVLFVPADGANYVFDATNNSWVSVSPEVNIGISNSTLFTIALINGVTYICYAGLGVFSYSSQTQTLTKHPLTSLVEANILGICASSGYLIAWTYNAVYWSSLINPFDFTPSIQTGAGGGQLQKAKGNINFCLPISSGFIAYCDQNCVSAGYTNNVNYPFLFNELANSGGCSDPTQVAWQLSSDTHYLLGTNGIQALNLGSAQAVFPEVTDFLAAQLFEDFSESTLLFTETYLSAPLATRLTYISERWLVFSYGVTSPNFTHAIVFDTVLGRYGKLKINHRCIFQFGTPDDLGITWAQLLAAGTTMAQMVTANTTYANLLNSIVGESQKLSLAVLQQNGAVSLVNFELSETNADGVFLLGKYQLKRNATITHQRTIIESVNPGSTFTPYLLPTLDGKTFQTAVPLVEIGTAAGLSSTWGKRTTGINISLLLIGSMNLTTVVLEFTSGGFR